jgi:hypothetical protein
MNWGANKDAIIVVWCGVTHHTNNTMFRGILMNLTGDGLNPDGSSFASNCADDTDADGDGNTAEGDPNLGVYTIDQGAEMWGWLYSEGGTPERSGIVISSSGSTSGNNSVPGQTELHFRSGANWNFLDDTFSSPSVITEVSVVGWRELYE